ncbi:MAG: sigma-E processing peptidase SpoIIGA, partial [Clostridia bacterium]|nr:sigma-E processing peptidase SpoIIGA [Clostridia bacterium]
MPYVYGDLFALLNFLVDLILLYATAKLAGLRAAPWRVVAAAAAGAFYAYRYLITL